MSIADLQARFQAAILGVDSEQKILNTVKPSQKLTAKKRFDVYAEAYRLRLKGFLAADFKVLNNALGDDGFETLSEAYVDATPSRHRNARWYARELPDFIEKTPPWNESRSLLDIARLEQALADTFDAADASPRPITDLAALAASEWQHARFSFHPSVVLLTVAQGTAEAYRAAAAETECPPPDETRDEDLLIWRHPNLQVLVRPLEAAEAIALGVAFSGESFGEICAILQFRDAHDVEEVATRAAGYLAQWFRDGLIVGTRII